MDSIVKQMEKEGCPGKLTRIDGAVAGPQRKIYPETYDSHTPGVSGKENFSCFSTSAIKDRKGGVNVLRQMIPMLEGNAGAVVEVERVVALRDRNGWRSVDPRGVLPYSAREIGFERDQSLPFEIHHAFELPRREASAMRLEEFAEEAAEMGIVAGGWFSFVREGGQEVSYRSNAFTEANLRDLVEHEFQLLDRYLWSRSREYKLWTLVENVLGIWHIR